MFILKIRDNNNIGQLKKKLNAYIDSYITVLLL